MNFWRQVPFARIFIPLALGLTCYVYSQLPLVLFIFATALAFTIYLVAHFTSVVPLFYQPKYKGLALFLCYVSLGYVAAYTFDEQHHTLYFKDKPGPYVVVRIQSTPEKKTKTYKIEGQIKAIGQAHQLKKASGKVLLYLGIKQQTTLTYGDELLIARNTLKPVAKPKNPFEFDYANYLHLNNIHHQGYVPPEQWAKLNTNSGYALFNFAYAMRNHLHRVYSSYLHNKQHRGIVEALVFGYRTDLDKNIINAYSKTGIIHVLAVSGLHVGLIYFVLNLLTLGLTKSDTKKKIRVLIILTFLFLYALITGFSPSVCRAALMFAFFVYSDAIRRDTNTYNVLFASATLLLLIQPFWLFHVGFQLSYLAVISIVYLQPYIRKWLVFTDWFLNKAWTLMAVSISAQIITFPLCLYYFHQYPNLFFISNLVVIPLIFVVLTLAAFLPLFSLFPILTPVCKVLAALIDTYLSFINALVIGIQNLPYAFFDNVYVSFSEMLMVYTLIGAILYGFIHKKTASFVVASFACLLLITSQTMRAVQNQAQKGWVSFHINNHPNLGYKNGRDLLLFCDSALRENPQLFAYHCKPWFMARCGGTVTFKPIQDLMKHDITLVDLNGDAIIIPKINPVKVLPLLPENSFIFSPKPLYLNHQISTCKIVAPRIVAHPKPPQWHDVMHQGFWQKLSS